MADLNLQQIYADLFHWCRDRDFAGYDPFDALNSRLFQATPLRHSRFARLAWTQLLKRSPLNLRPVVFIPPEKNAKGIALFALALLAEYRRTRSAAAEQFAKELLDQLVNMKIAGWSGAAWGYNFDWQSRVLFAPRDTPAIVPTAFAARALVEAHNAFGDDQYLTTARSVCDFIIQDLPRSLDNVDQLCFSYTPNSETRVFNASLFAAEILSTVGQLTGEQELTEMAIRATRYVVRHQSDNGSWSYGAAQGQEWVDNFHTAFVLSSLVRIIRTGGAETSEFEQPLLRGHEFWRERFFLADGWPKYYDDSPFPADVHAAATAIATLADLKGLDEGALPLAEKIAAWSVQHLRDSNGFFYYQQRRFYLVRTPFMRWNEAWMLYGLSRLMEEQEQGVNGKHRDRKLKAFTV